MKVKTDAASDPSAKSQLMAQWELHKRKAERAYQELKEDTARAKMSVMLDVLTFDLQQALPTPMLKTSVVFYKRQMWVYNLGVHDCKSSKGFMCMWEESVASRGSQEIGSCLLKCFQHRASSATHLVLYSDSCGGQNRNINLACMWLHVVASDDYSYTTVDHKFMVSGHSYLPNDRDFASIENMKRKTQHIYVPSQWYELVRDCRRQNPFEVLRMKAEDFRSINPVRLCITNRKVNTNKSKVQWLNIRWARFEKSEPFQMKYRFSHNDLEPWKILNLKKRQKGRPRNVGQITLPLLRENPPGLKKNKLTDILSLLDYVPPVYHDYYTQLSFSSVGDECSSEEESESETDEQED